MDKKHRLTGYVGVAGSLLMYTGDMLLYFTTQPIPDREKICCFLWAQCPWSVSLPEG